MLFPLEYRKAKEVSQMSKRQDEELRRLEEALLESEDTDDT